MKYTLTKIVFEGIELLACFVECYLLYLIYEGLFEKYRSIQNKKIIIVLVFIEVMLTRCCNYISAFSYATLVFFIIYMSISATILYRVSFIKIFSIACFYTLCLSVIEGFIISLFSSLWNGKESFEQLVSHSGVPRIEMLFVMKSVEIILYFCLKKYLKKISEKMKNAYVVLVFSVLGSIGYVYFANQMFRAFNVTITGIWFFFMIVIILVLCVCYFISTQREEKMKLDFAEKRNYLLEENYNSIREIYVKNAKLYHDLNNHLSVLYQILDEGDIVEAKEYIEEISEPIRKLSKTVWTGVDVVDVILNSKIDRMEQKGISCECNVEFPKHTNLSTHDICTILTNLLDNAIEAAQLSEGERKISLTIRRVEHFLLIKISNTCSGENKSFVHFPATTKENKELHGWGLSNVKDAVDKYNGTLKCEREGNQFTVNVLLFFEMVSEGSGKEERQ